MNVLLLAAAFVDRLAAVPTLDWLLWIGSGALSIALVIVLRTRWGQSRPLQKCAVLSLLVHALLACLAMTIRVVVGDGGGGAGAPLRVRLVEDVGVEIGIAHEAAQVTSSELVAPTPIYDLPELESESASESVAEPTEQPLPAEPPPLFAPKPVVADQPVDELAPEVDAKANLADSEKAAEIAAANLAISEGSQAPPEPVDVAPTDTDHDLADSNPDDPPVEATQLPKPASQPADVVEPSIAPSIAESPSIGRAASASTASAPYALRSAPGRLGLVELQGGNAQTEAAVAAALAWLARAQSADGRWDANRFGAGQEQNVLGQDRGGAGRNADTGISALALLAFLGAGHSHQQGDYQDTVRRGFEFLISSQEVDGNLFGQSTFYAQMYCHSMATFALAEALAMTGDARLEPAVHKAIGFSLRAQNPATGGWRYRPTYDTGDTSQLGWQMMALASAQRAGVDVPTHTWTRAGRFLRSVKRGSYGGLASYRPDGPATTSMTAEALYCRLLLDEVNGGELDEQSCDEATNRLLASLPDAGRVNLYYWYYATLALHRRQSVSNEAAAAWHKWNDSLIAALMQAQVPGGPDTGSWNTNTAWGGYGGRVYTTAMAAMCLEVYYRYAPTPAEHSIASPRRSQDRPR
jgi:hypothetical protein